MLLYSIWRYQTHSFVLWTVPMMSLWGQARFQILNLYCFCSELDCLWKWLEFLHFQGSQLKVRIEYSGAAGATMAVLCNWSQKTSPNVNMLLFIIVSNFCRKNTIGKLGEWVYCRLREFLKYFETYCHSDVCIHGCSVSSKKFGPRRNLSFNSTLESLM